MLKNITIGDKSYSVSSDDDYLVAMGDNFEPHMVDLFSALISLEDVVGDIGANIGLTAILFSTLASKVYAFEPSPSTYKILVENLDLAGVTSVVAINLGLGSKPESLMITFAENNRSGGFVSDKIRLEAGHKSEKIKIDTLDNYFSDSEDVPSFLKIDVEGFEQNVIKGGAEFLQKYKPTVVMEMNHFCLDVLQRITIPDFLDFMRSVFPYLYAVDADNMTIEDLHKPDRAYSVMHEHVVRNRFPNIVGGYDELIGYKLSALSRLTVEKAKRNRFQTPALLNPKGAIEVDEMLDVMVCSESIEIAVTLRNDGAEAWYGYGTHPVFLCYHWQDANDGYVVYDGIRTELKSQIVQPGEAVKEDVRVTAPAMRGNLTLVLTLVQEGVCWFEDKGFNSLCGMIDVR